MKLVDPTPTRTLDLTQVDNKRMLQKLLEEWSRHIFKKTKDYKQLAVLEVRFGTGGWFSLEVAWNLGLLEPRGWAWNRRLVQVWV